MAEQLAAAHPTETWQAIGGSAVMIMGLIGVLYRRLNKDIDDGEKRQDQFDTRMDGALKEQESLATHVGTLIKQVEEIFKKLSTGAESFSSLNGDIREIKTKIENMIKDSEQRSNHRKEETRELKEELRKLQGVLDSVQKECIKQHSGGSK